MIINMQSSKKIHAWAQMKVPLYKGQQQRLVPEMRLYKGKTLETCFLS